MKTKYYKSRRKKQYETDMMIACLAILSLGVMLFFASILI